MKKNLLCWMTILMVAIVSVNFVSCGDDDEKTSVNTPIDNPNNTGGSSSGGVSNGSDYQVQTGNASDITDNSVMLSGSFTSTNGKPNRIGFLIGTSSDLTITNRLRDLVIFDIISPFSATVDGLQSQSTYYYRAYAYSTKNDRYTYGETKSFTTSSGNGNNGGSSTAKGSGTQNSPYNVAAIIEIAGKLRAGEIDATNYFFKGTISQITKEFTSEKDSTATFYITDGTATDQFLCSKVRFFHDEGWWGVYQINIGDEVVICGKVTKDKNGVVGTSDERAYIYSLNGNTGTTDEIEYRIGDRTFRTVLVEGGPMKPFYIMQTEIPLNSDITINNRVVTRLNRNRNKLIEKSEFMSFLKDLRNVTGYRFRLPTKEEWQYAARGGNKSKGYTYSGSNTADDVAWYSGNSNKQGHDIAMKQANELGLYDMSGNYAEVCAMENKEDEDIDGPMYGGSWNDTASDCTVSSWIEGKISGYSTIDGKKYSNKYSFDARYNTVRLVYTKY